MDRDRHDFGRLALTTTSRREFLASLPGHLDKYELMSLRDRLAPISFKYDIIGNLPLELVTFVFGNLSPIAPFAFLAVSKTWRDLLSSDVFQERALASFVGPQDPLLCEEAQASRADRIKYRYLQRFAFTRQLPFSISVLKIPLTLRYYNPSPLRPIAYVHGKLAWIDLSSDSPSATLWDLYTGKRSKYRTESRAKILAITLSSKLLAVVTFSGQCCAWSTQGDIGEVTETSIKLPSANVVALSSRENSVVLCLLDGDQTTVCIWESESQKIRYFTLRLPELVASVFQTTGWAPREAANVETALRSFYTEVAGLILAPDGLSLALICAVLSYRTCSTDDEDRCESIFALRFDSSGAMLSCNALHFRDDRFDIREYRTVSANNDGLFAIHMSSNWGGPQIFRARAEQLSLEVPPMLGEYLIGGLVLFDEKVDRLYIQKLDLSQAREVSIVYWKGHISQRLFPHPRNPIYRFTRTLQCLWTKNDIPGAHWQTHEILGDDHFLVSLTEKGNNMSLLDVQCFDPGLKLPRSRSIQWNRRFPKADDHWWRWMSPSETIDTSKAVASHCKSLVHVRSLNETVRRHGPDIDPSTYEGNPYEDEDLNEHNQDGDAFFPEEVNADYGTD